MAIPAVKNRRIHATRLPIFFNTGSRPVTDQMQAPRLKKKRGLDRIMPYIEGGLAA